MDASNYSHELTADIETINSLFILISNHTYCALKTTDLLRSVIETTNYIPRYNKSIESTNNTDSTNDIIGWESRELMINETYNLLMLYFPILYKFATEFSTLSKYDYCLEIGLELDKEYLSLYIYSDILSRSMKEHRHTDVTDELYVNSDNSLITSDNIINIVKLPHINTVTIYGRKGIYGRDLNYSHLTKIVLSGINKYSFGINLENATCLKELEINSGFCAQVLLPKVSVLEHMDISFTKIEHVDLSNQKKLKVLKLFKQAVIDSCPDITWLLIRDPISLSKVKIYPINKKLRSIALFDYHLTDRSIRDFRNKYNYNGDIAGLAI